MLVDANQRGSVLCCGGESATADWISSISVHIAQVLAPPGYGPLASWLTGWSNWLGLVTCAPSVNYAGSAMILAAASIANPSYVPQTYQLWLLTVLLLLIHACIGSLPTKWLANINSVGSTLNLVAVIAVIIIIPAQTTREDQGLSRFAPSNEVWGSFYDGTSYSNGVSLLMSFISVIWTMRYVWNGPTDGAC